MLVTRTQYFIYNIAVTGEKNKSLRILVKPADRKDPFCVIDIIYNVVPDVRLGCTGNTRWFIKGEEDDVLGLPGFNGVSVYHYLVGGEYAVTDLRFSAVDENLALFNVPVGLTPGTYPAFADVFV